MLNFSKDYSSSELLSLRSDFPLLNRNPDLIYLDTASTSQKPDVVINSIVNFYETTNANTGRGVYKLAGRADQALEIARENVSNHLGVNSPNNIIFTKGATESLNIVAHSYLKQRLEPNDKIILGGAEHHANIVPWQIIAKEKNASIEYIPILENGELDLVAFEQLLDKKVKIISLAHVSNVLGTKNSIKEIISTAHNYNIPVCIDGAQAVSHIEVDCSDLDCDFYTFSSHKVYGPMGAGVLFVKDQYLEEMSPFLTGGGMIEEVNNDYSTYVSGFQKFEVGTQSISDIVGLSSAIDYVNSIGIKNIQAHENILTKYLENKFKEMDEIILFGPKENRPSPIFSFILNGIHPHDLATILDSKNISVRAGHHCNQHAMRKFNINSTNRVSFGIYNTLSDIDCLIDAIHYSKKILKK